MIRIGLKYAVAAKLLKDLGKNETEDGNPVLQYGPLRQLPKLQKLDYTPKITSVVVPADDQDDEEIEKCFGVDGSVQRKLFTPEDMAFLFGEKKVGEFYGSNKDDEPGMFAFGFVNEISNSSGKFMYTWLLKTKFKHGQFQAETMGNDTLTPQPDIVSFRSSARNADGEWRFYQISDDPEFAKTFFTQDTLQTLATTGTVVAENPAEVVFADSVPSTGEVGKIYIVADKSYYWNGTAMVESASKA